MNVRPLTETQMDNALSSGEISQKKYDNYIKKLNSAEEEMKNLEEQKKQLDEQLSGGHITADEYRFYRRELEQVRAETRQFEKDLQQLDDAADQSSKAFRRAVEGTKEYQQAIDRLSKANAELEEINKGLKLDPQNVELLSQKYTVLSEKLEATRTRMEALEKAQSDAKKSLSDEEYREYTRELELTKVSAAALEKEMQQLDGVTDKSSKAFRRAVESTKEYQQAMTQLLEAYVQAGGMLKNLNVGLDESATLLGVLANRGIKGQEAGHALNSILINLVGANKNAASAMDALGVSAYDTNDKFIGITETLRLVSKKLNEIKDDEQAVSVFTAKIGGKTQYDTLMALLNGVNGEYDDLLEKIKNSNGALEETAKIMRDNLEGDVTMLKSALDNDVKKLSESTQKSINRSEAEILVIEDKAKEYEELRKEYEELRKKQGDTAEQEERLKDLANDLQQYMPDSIQLIDEQTGAYNSLGNAIDGVIASMKKNAYVQAYENQITEIATAQIEAKKNLEELQKEFDAVDARLKGKGAYEVNGTIGFSNPIDALANMSDLTAWEMAKSAINEAEKSVADYDKQIEELGKNIEGAYSEFNKNQVADVPADGARIAAEGMIQQYEEAYRNAEKTIAEDQANVLENLQNKMDELEKKKNLHQFANDTEYWNERRRVLAENQHEELEEWWKYYDETESYTLTVSR